MKRVLVIDVGGTNIKTMISRSQRRKINTGPHFGPRDFSRAIKDVLGDWKFDVVSVGFPAPVRDGKILAEPKNLGAGWQRFDFSRGLGKPVRVVNDAAMQALGSYRNGRMLFLGLGTGLGSALVYRNTVLSLELGDLPYVDAGRLEDRLGKAGLKRLGRGGWLSDVKRVVRQLKIALIADYVVLGGGNAKLLSLLPAGVELGHNRNAYIGGARLWQTTGGKRRWVVI